jgi:hypothetical protein
MHRHVWWSFPALIFVAILSADAQQAQPPQSPQEQVLWAKYLREAGDNVACNVALVELRQRLEEAQSKIRDLEAKAGGVPPLEPKQ